MGSFFTRRPLPVLVINLDRDVERMQGTIEAFAGLNKFELRRSPGVIPAMPNVAKTYLTGRRRTDAGTLGAFLAHVLAWETVIEIDAPTLVIEDDAKPAKLKRLFALDLPADLGVLHLNHRMADPPKARGALAVVPAATILPHKLAFAPHLAAPGGDGYLLTPAAARALLRALLRDGFDDHVDWRLLRYGCDRAEVARIGGGTWMEKHWPLRDGDKAPQWNVVRSYRTTHPLIALRGLASTREAVTRES